MDGKTHNTIVSNRQKIAYEDALKRIKEKDISVAPLKYIPEDFRLVPELDIPESRLNICKTYKDQESVFWTEEEIVNDRADFGDLDDSEKRFIKFVLGFFAPFDNIVNVGMGKIISSIRIPEFTKLYSWQIAMENIHAKTYARLIENNIGDSNEISKMLNEVLEAKCIKDMISWADSKQNGSFTEILYANACIECIFFGSGFVPIFWLQERGLMPGLSYANELISRDENMHVNTAVLVYSYLLDDYKMTQSNAEKLTKECVTLAKSFIDESMSDNLKGLSIKKMKEYIECMADNLLAKFGFELIYKTKNPLKFMEKINLVNKTSPHEKRIAEYQRAVVKDDNMVYKTDEIDFNF